MSIFNTEPRKKVDPLPKLDTKTQYVSSSQNIPAINGVSAEGTYKTDPATKQFSLGTDMLVGLAPSLIGGITTIGGAMFNNLNHKNQQNELEWNKLQQENIDATQNNTYGGIMAQGGGGDPETPMFVQAEKGEVIVDTSGNIYDVKAKTTHKQQKGKKEITDVLMPNSYMLSNKIKISKEKADKIMISLDPMSYSEFDNNGGYKENTLGDLFKSKEHTLAELGGIIRKMFPVENTDGNNNQFVRKTNEENKQKRLAYIMKLIELNEMKGKTTNPLKEAIPKMGMGGGSSVCPPGKIWDARLNKCMSIYPSFTNLIKLDDIEDPYTDDPTYTVPLAGAQQEQQYSSKLDSVVPKINVEKPDQWAENTAQHRQYILNELKKIPSRENESRKMANVAFANQVGSTGIASLLGIAGTIGQNNYLDTPTATTPKLRRTTDRSYYDYLGWQNRKAFNTLKSGAFENTSDYGRAMSYILPAYANNVNANSQIAVQFGQSDMATENAYQQALAATKAANSQAFANSSNSMRAGGNQALSQITGFGINGINQLGGLNTARLNYMNKLKQDALSNKYKLYDQLALINQIGLGVKGYYGSKTTQDAN
jgi:hypothetical protein